MLFYLLLTCLINSSYATTFRELKQILPNEVVSFAKSDDFNCTDKADCNYRGQCTETGKCKCNDGYITFKPSKDIQCNYEQKNTVTAFCLQLFFGYVGIGEWYLENNDIAGGQLGLFLGIFVLICIAMCAGLKSDGDTPALAMLIGCICCLAFVGMIIWDVYTIVIIGSGTETDGNGASIQSL